MRLKISTILCLTLFALTNAAPSKPREESETAKKDDQAPPEVEAQADPFAFMSPDQQYSDCCAPGPACANPCAPQPPPMMPLPPPPPAAPCCAPGPSCANPCAPPPPPMMPLPPPLPPPPAAPCCDPGTSCFNPCGAPPMAPPVMAPPMGGPCCDPAFVNPCDNPCAPPAAADEGQGERQAYAPYPGEITFKLMQKWKDRFLDEQSSAYNILAGNVKNAIEAAIGGGQNDYVNQWDPYGQYATPQSQVSVSNIYFREGYVPGNPSTMPITVAHVMVNGGSDDASRLQSSVTPDGSLGDGLKVYKDSFSAY